MAIMSETSTISQNDLKHEQNHTTLWRLMWGEKKGLGNQLRLHTFWKSLCSLLAWRTNNFSVSCGGRYIITVLILLSLILLIYNPDDFFPYFPLQDQKFIFFTSIQSLSLKIKLLEELGVVTKERSDLIWWEWFLSHLILISASG